MRLLMALTSRFLEEALVRIKSQLGERGLAIQLTLTRADTLQEALEELSL